MDQTTIVSAACQICTIFLVFQGSRCLIPSFASTRDKNWENKSFEISNRKGEENKELKINERRSGQSRTSLLFCSLCQLHRSAEQNTRMAKGFSVTRDGWQTWCVIGHKLAAWGVIGHRERGGMIYTLGNFWRGCAVWLSKSWHYFKPKKFIFHTYFQTWVPVVEMLDSAIHRGINHYPAD